MKRIQILLLLGGESCKQWWVRQGGSVAQGVCAHPDFLFSQRGVESHCEFVW